MTIKRSPFGIVTPVTPDSVSTTSGWAEDVRRENTAAITADIEAALNTRRRDAKDVPVADRAQLKAAQDNLQTLKDFGLDGLPGR